MNVLIAWQPRNAADSAALFQQVMQSWTRKYEQWTRQKLSADTRTAPGGLIGLIAGANQPQPWLQADSGTAVWAGMCENPPADSGELIRWLERGGAELGNLAGRFVMASLHGRELRVTMSAVEPLAAWYVEGPRGWAAGTRVQPLLELVGKPARPDLAAMSTFAVYGWTVGGHGVFQDARRLALGGQLIGADGQLKFATHTPLAELFRVKGEKLPFAEAVRRGAQTLRQRVGAEVRLSAAPVVFLSGGRDSRVILAAGAPCIPPLSAATYGDADGKEFLCAAGAAKAVNAPHRRMEWLSIADLVLQHETRVGDYLRWSEGTDKVSHLENHLGWFGDEPAVQRFTGLGGEINRGGFYSKYFKGAGKHLRRAGRRDIDEVKKQILRRRVERLGAPPEARALVEQVFAQVDAAAGELAADVWLWLDLFYFAERTTHWGADGMSAWSWGGWTWTPFVDRELINLGRHLTHGQRSRDAWPQALIAALEPRLAGVSYSGLSWPRKMLRKLLGPRTAPAVNAKEQAAVCAAWKRIFERKDVVWPKLVDEKLVRGLLADPARALSAQKFLWQLATMELLAQNVFN